MLFIHGMKDKLEAIGGNDFNEKTKTLLKEYLENDSISLKNFTEFLFNFAIINGEVEY